MSNKINPHHDAPVADKDVDLGTVYTRTELFIENNKNAIIIGVVGILVVVGGLLGYKKLIAEPKAVEAAENMWKAEYYFEIDSLNKALNGDDQWPGFITIAQEYGSTPSGNLANYYLGAIYMQQGEYEAALEHYKKADLDDDVLRVMAIGNQGDALVELGRTDEAVKQFEKAAGMTSNELIAPMYLMKAGILHQQAANWSGAAKAFKRIATEFPTSQEASTARKYAGHAEAMGG
ncbi:MAG TPA: tetratricopeptide repeat protein [Flavobacteriales bacterium]|nr:tetratricopeptide repeat protein [Flavobacteriales bacterium]